MSMAPMRDADLEARRDLAVLRYVDGIDRGDLDAIAPVLAEAEVDAELDRRLIDVTAALHAEANLGPTARPPQGAISVLRHMLMYTWDRRETMTTVDFLRDQILSTREFLEATMADVTTEQAHWNAQGRALPIAGQYAHIIVSMDGGLHGLLQGQPPLAATSWAGKTGFSSIPQLGPGQSWEQWAAGPFDLTALRAYAQAVYRATDEYLASLTPEDLNRPLDLSSMGLGERSFGWMLTTGWIVNANMHCGEIACIKGLQGAQGYPF